MAENTDNLTLKLLQEMRDDIQGLHSRFDKVDEQLQDINTRIDGVTHIMTFLAGCNYQLDERVTKLETKRP